MSPKQDGGVVEGSFENLLHKRSVKGFGKDCFGDLDENILPYFSLVQLYVLLYIKLTDMNNAKMQLFV